LKKQFYPSTTIKARENVEEKNISPFKTMTYIRNAMDLHQYAIEPKLRHTQNAAKICQHLYIKEKHMSRTERLFSLIQLLRRRRYPVSGKTLALELGISLRTLYRDIASLQAQGAQIEGEPGLGYVLRPGFMLPPLMFSEEEIEALVLGIRWVSKKADSDLRFAAHDALAKIASVLPCDLRNQLEVSSLMVGPSQTIAAGDEELSLIRKAIRKQIKLDITYNDLNDKKSQRIIWPLGLAFFDHVRIIIAFCELRQDFRHFRTDRVMSFSTLATRYPKSRTGLLKKWREINNIPAQ
jgi:predicted DNA-binding transcriptional regulator YafY